MIEGTQHPDRDGQFRYVNEQVSAHLEAGQPVVSVYTKKKDTNVLATRCRRWDSATRNRAYQSARVFQNISS
jgi:hypothetical protein